RAGAEEAEKEEAACAFELQRYAALSERAAQAAQEYALCNAAFIRGQAALLSAELAEQLRRSGSALCPVCHAAYDAQHMPPHVERGEAVPAQAEVDRAQQTKAAAEQEQSEQRAKCSALQSALRSRREELLSRAKELSLPFKDWAELSAQGALEALLAQALREGQSLSTKFKHADERRGQLARDRKELEQQKKAAAEADRRAQEQGRMAEALATQHAELAGAIRRQEEHLAYPSRAAAQERLDACRAEHERLRSRLAQAQAALEQAQQALHGSLGQQRTLSEEMQRAREELSRRAVQTEAAVSAAGFADEQEANAALKPIGTGDSEHFLRERRGEIEGYARACAAAASETERLRTQTQGLQLVDLAALDGQTAAAQEEQRRLEADCSRAR
ncbi:MAG: hypothetical protein Q4A66_11990, partial [Eubacteriales bacterium]|nr:hypothetical protein [Eubacteriales bacterium]